MTILWAAVTFILLEMSIDAIAATISVAAAACGGPHAEGWPALPLHSSSGDESFGTCLEHARNVMNLCSFKRMADV